MHEARYASSSVDEFSRLAVVKHLVKKSDPPQKFQEFVAEHGVPQCMRLDNGGETSPYFLQRFSGEPRVHRAYTQQYVVAERKTVQKSYLRVFGCLVYYLDLGNRRKLDPKSKKSKFISYDEESKA